jgi:hypothetical protein
MALEIPADQVSVRGVLSAAVGPVGGKPMSFSIQPQFIQKRIESFDNAGYRVPGIPVGMAKDPKVTAGYNTVNAGIAGMAGVDAEQFYTALVVFKYTNDDEITFEGDKLVIDGSAINIDPLSDAAQFTFYITGEWTFN